MNLANVLVLAALAGLWTSGRLVVSPGPFIRPAEPESPARVEPAPVEPAEMTPETGPAPAGRTRAPARPRTAPQAVMLTQARVSELAAPSAGALRACLTKPDPIDLELTVEAGRARLTRVEWLPHDPANAMERCLARAIGAIAFPKAPTAGPFRLEIDG